MHCTLKLFLKKSKAKGNFIHITIIIHNKVLKDENDICFMYIAYTTLCTLSKITKKCGFFLRNKSTHHHHRHHHRHLRLPHLHHLQIDNYLD